MAVLFPRVLKPDDKVDENGDEERNTDEDGTPELVERAGMARGNHSQALLVDNVGVDENGGGAEFVSPGQEVSTLTPPREASVRRATVTVTMTDRMKRLYSDSFQPVLQPLPRQTHMPA